MSRYCNILHSVDFKKTKKLPLNINRISNTISLYPAAIYHFPNRKITIEQRPRCTARIRLHNDSSLGKIKFFLKREKPIGGYPEQLFQGY